MDERIVKFRVGVMVVATLLVVGILIGYNRGETGNAAIFEGSRAIPVTLWPRRDNSAVIREPAWPEAPISATFMRCSFREELLTMKSSNGAFGPARKANA